MRRLTWFANARTLLVAVVLGAAGSVLQVLAQPLASLDGSIHDEVLAHRAPDSYLGRDTDTARDPRAFITIIAIDERTLAELGAYNGGYPRAYHAQLIENLLAAPPRAIALDLGFFEPTPDDAILAAALDHAQSLSAPTTVILSTAGLPQSGHLAGSALDGELAFDHGLAPVPLLAARAEVALANVVPDARGTIRSMPLLAYVEGVERQSLSLAATAAYLRRPGFIDGRSRGSLRLAGRDIPVDADGFVRINFLGTPSRPYNADSTFRVISFVDVLRGRIDPAVWRGGLVFVGALGATGLADDYWTPTSDQGRKMAGVEIHANAAATLFSTNFLRTVPVGTQAALIFAVALLLSILAARSSVVAAFAVCPLALVALGLLDAWLLYAFGLLVPLAAPALVGLVSFAAQIAPRLVSEQRQARALQAALATERTHDPLTGLANRNQFLAEVRRTLSDSRSNGRYALLVLDVDRFKDVNDTLGHGVGDLLLERIARRLSHGLAGSHAMIARLGGDEFAAMLPVVGPATASAVCIRLLEILEEPMAAPDHPITLTGSIGVALYPEHGDDVETLLRRADVAMYTAKQERSGHAMYAPGQEQQAAERLTMETALRQAIARDQLCLFYQPKVDCRSGSVTGVEALVRWQHPHDGLVMPDRFISLAEETGLIRPLTRWVLETAVRQTRAWLDEGLAIKMAVNLSTFDLQNIELAQQLGDLLAACDVPGELLSLEITETALLADPNRALTVLQELAARGVHASLDDFGTGYSSLTYLRQLPLKELKIEASFVRNIARADDRDRAIVCSTIELGHRLGLSVVAEGVEDRATLELLKELGCNEAQGYFLSRPLPADEVAEWLRSHVDLESRRAAA